MYIPMRQLVCSSFLVNGITTVWTNNFRMGFGVNFGIQIQCTSAPAIRVQLEHSYLDLTDGTLGTTNQQGLTNSAYVVPDAFPDVFSDIVDTNWHIKSVFPVPAYWCRYKISGLSGNASDTTITIYNTIQEPSKSYGA